MQNQQDEEKQDKVQQKVQQEGQQVPVKQELQVVEIIDDDEPEMELTSMRLALAGLDGLGDDGEEQLEEAANMESVAAEMETSLTEDDVDKRIAAIQNLGN